MKIMKDNVVPDLVIGPHNKTTWLNKVGEELKEWATCDNDLMFHKPMRQAWTEAIKIKRDIEKQFAAKQETILQKQDVTAEQIQRLTTIVQELKDHLLEPRSGSKKEKTEGRRDQATSR